jgi:methionyl-tRNA synthetase
MTLEEKPQPPTESGPPKADPQPAPPEPKRLSIDRFFETELRVAQILSAERVENTDKLLKLQVDLGTEKRQLVAGVAGSYEPESLVGRRIIVVANLKPARIRGVESQGMLLAADLGGRPILATFDEDVPPGTRVR